MKNKIFSLMAVVMFVGSSLNLNAATLEVYNDCAAEAFELQGELEDMGVEKRFANEVANIIYEDCMESNNP